MGVLRLIVVLLWLAIAVPLVAGTEAASAQEPPPDKPPAEPGPPSGPPPGLAKHPKLASSLLHLLEAVSKVPVGLPITDDSVASVQPAAGALLKAGLLRVDVQGRVQVYIHISEPNDTALHELKPLGVVVERSSDSGSLVQARVPVKALHKLAGLDLVTAVSPPKYARVDVGSQLTQGDALLDLDDLRATFGVNGTGVTAGWGGRHRRCWRSSTTSHPARNCVSPTSAPTWSLTPP